MYIQFMAMLQTYNTYLYGTIVVRYECSSTTTLVYATIAS